MIKKKLTYDDFSEDRKEALREIYRDELRSNQIEARAEKIGLYRFFETEVKNEKDRFKRI